jgi:hypothetical protein
MTRILYASLLRLHPNSFRREFGAEMFLIFEEASPGEGSVALLLDAVVSLLRQWFLRSGLWKIGAAALCAALQLAPCLAWGWRPRVLRNLRPAGTPIEPDGFVAITCFLVAFIVLMVTASVFWATSVSRIRRLSAKRRVG